MKNSLFKIIWFYLDICLLVQIASVFVVFITLLLTFGDANNSITIFTNNFGELNLELAIYLFSLPGIIFHFLIEIYSVYLFLIGKSVGDNYEY